MDEELIVKCWKCHTDREVTVVPVRNPDNSIMAFVFSCESCLKYILGRSTTITVGDEEIIGGYIN